MNKPTYPATHKVEQVDHYHGVDIADPYRWLEEASAERSQWIAAQNDVTAAYLSGIQARCQIRSRFEELLRYRRDYTFVRRDPYIFFRTNAGLQNQLVVCVQHGLDGSPDVLIDPTTFAPDGTTRVTGVVPSRDARYVAYGLSHGGSDWQEYYIKDMATRCDLPDTVRWVKLAAVAWSGDGFYYSRYPAPADPTSALSAPNDNHQVWYHRVGTAQSADTPVYQDPAHPLRLHFVQTTDDERFARLTIIDPAAGHPGNALWAMDAKAAAPGWTSIVTSFADEFRVVDNDADQLIVLTNNAAPNWRLVLIDPARPGERDWVEMIPETEHRLENVVPVGGKLFVTYRVHAAHRLYVFDRRGNLENEIRLPGLGVSQVVPGQPGDQEALWSFATFTTPPVVYCYRIGVRTSTTFRQPSLAFNADDFETNQTFYQSKDGTRIPMFLVHRKGLVRDGRHPLLLYGYGGNGTSVGPAFDPLLLTLLERGVIYAVACLRGGGEYGETWHRAGWRENKQNTFDDCIAAIEWLHANGYSTPDRSALAGMSNGGLLVGAVMVQRPDLFKVALPDVGVMDMLRFQKFTVAAGWAVEYGSSEDPSMFPILLAYSPLHNLKEGVTYPATLVTTSEHDDRVVPAHSFKFVATLQSKGAGARPYLIRIESRSGHGAVSLPKAIDERADLYAFLLAHVTDTPEAGLG